MSDILDIPQLKSEARVLLVEACQRTTQALRKLEQCNPRRFEQTSFRKELQAIERKLSKMQIQLNDLDL